MYVNGEALASPSLMVLHVSLLCLFLLKVKRSASPTVSETSFYPLSFLEDFWGLKRQFVI